MTKTTPQTNTSHKHLTTLEGAATTVRATSHARVGGCAEVSGKGSCSHLHCESIRTLSRGGVRTRTQLGTRMAQPVVQG